MKYLVIAYEFPPSPSPQSIRWMYLSRELVELGHEVHVLTCDLQASSGAISAPAGVSVHSTYAGPVRGALNFVSSMRRRSDGPDVAGAESGAPSEGGPVRLNWKGRLWEALQSVLRAFMYPDLRAEWKGSAKKELRALLESVRPDVVISSHEPATTLQLGLYAKRRGFPWIADLGDPVLAPYTPWWWRRRAHSLERRTCVLADQVIVTNTAAAALMTQRHGIGVERVKVLSQGFDPAVNAEPRDPAACMPLRLLYTGSFYDFRRVECLLDAVLGLPGVTLEIACSRAPPDLLRRASENPTRIKVLGFRPHEEILRLQRGADILVNIGNPDSSQVPGKVFEYMGACRPILHLSQDLEGDEAAGLIDRTRRGWVVAYETSAISKVLRSEVERRTRRAPCDLDLSLQTVEQYSWPSLASRLEAVSLEATA